MPTLFRYPPFLSNKVTQGETANSDDGFTLLELLIASILTITVTLSLSALFYTYRKAYSVQDNVTQMNQGARVAMDLITREIRLIGSGVPRRGNPAAADPVRDKITSADSATLQFKGNINLVSTTLSVGASKGSTTLQVADSSRFSVNDNIFVDDGKKWHNATVSGVASGTLTINPGLNADYSQDSLVSAVDAVTYTLDVGNLRITRRVGAGLFLRIAENVPSGGLGFRYFDANNNELTSPPLSALARKSVRSIEIALKVRTALPDPNYPPNGGYRVITLKSYVTPRNLAY